MRKLLLLLLSLSFMNVYSQELWNTTNNKGKSSIRNVEILNDSLILIAGSQNGVGCPYTYLSVYDIEGNLKWTKSGSFDKVYTVGSSLYVAGISIGMDDVPGDEYYVLTKMDSSGNVLFSESYKTENYKRVTGITQFSNGYIAFTDHESYAINESLYVTDSVGNLINQITLGFDESIQQIKALGDTNMLISTVNHLFRTNLQGEHLDTLNINNIKSFKVESKDQIYVITSSQLIITDVLFSKKEVITESDVLSFGKSRNEVAITEVVGDSLYLYSLIGSSFIDTISIPLFLNNPIVLVYQDQYFVAGNTNSSQVGLYNSYETKKTTLGKLPDVELLSFEIDSVKFQYDYFDNRKTGFTYQPRLTIRNNGTDTLKSFTIFKYTGFGQNCYVPSYNKEIKGLEILPGKDSVIQIRDNVSQWGTNPKLCMEILAPNNKIEMLVSNNSICEEFEILSLEDKLENTIGNYTISPNPFTDIITLNNKSNERITSLSIYKMDGSNIFTSNKIQDNEIDLSFLDGGVYLVQIKTETNVYSKKILKN